MRLSDCDTQIPLARSESIFIHIYSIVSEFLGVLFMKVVYVFCPSKHQHAAKRVRGKWLIFLVNVFALAASPSNVTTVLQSS